MITKEQEQFVESLVSQKITAIKTEYEGTVAQLQAEVRSLKADLLYTDTQKENQRRDMIRGKATLHVNNGGTMRREDYEKVLPAKLEAHSLEEIVKMQMLDAGIDPRNQQAFEAFCGVDRNGMRAKK